MGAIAKILLFQGPRFLGFEFSQVVTNALEDLSFCFPLFGVVLTMGLDFLWALSSTMETNALFNRNISESAFVSNLRKIQMVLIPSLAMARTIPSRFGRRLDH